MILMARNGNRVIRLEENQPDIRRQSLERIYHDFCSPLNIIIGFSELMLDEMPGKINDEQRSALNDILNSGRRLLGLVDELFVPSASGSPEKISEIRSVKTAEIYYQQ